MRNRLTTPAVFVAATGFVTILSLGEIAVATGLPWLFPSAGPTAIMLFLTPHARAASPRNTVCGHLIGIVCAWISLWLTALVDAGAVDATTIGHDRVLAAALALASTGGLMIAFDVVHPPAGATTLIVALGFMTRLPDLLVIEPAIALLTAEAWLIHRIAGTRYPAWAPAQDDSNL
jgi:CBS-domain-containing membrane protein